MIWVKGEIVPDDALSISVLDRTFEHGLGLFETFRTWDGRPTLLGRHLGRLRRSAEELGVPIDPACLPDESAIRALRAAEGIDGDCSLRVVLSGGFEDGRPGTTWMRARPLPSSIPGPGAKVCSTWFAAEGDPMLGAKTLNYWSRRFAFEQAQRLGFDENLSRGPAGEILEGSRSNVFLVSEDRLLFPDEERTADGPSPFLPGIMRGVILERARALGMIVNGREHVSAVDIERADECFLSNSGRGIIPVAQFGPLGTDRPDRGRLFDPVPGPVTRRLMDDLDTWLRSEGAR
jgi:branched-subunit amino acid aminotransferase/4-amino-4-deoxychorismate lyase